MKKIVIYALLGIFVLTFNSYATDYIGLRDLEYSISTVTVSEGINLKEKVGFEESLGQYQLLQWDMAKGDTWDDGKGGLIQHKEIYKTVVIVNGELKVTVGAKVYPVKNKLGSDNGAGVVIHLMPGTPHKLEATTDALIMLFCYERGALLGRDSLNWLDDTHGVDQLGTDKTFGEVRDREDYHYAFDGHKIADYRLKVATYEAGNKLEVWNFIAAKPTIAMMPNPEGKDPAMVPITVPWHNHKGEVETFIILRGRIQMAFDSGERMPKPLSPDSQLWGTAKPGTVAHFSEKIWHTMTNFYHDATVLVTSPPIYSEQWYKETLFRVGNPLIS